MKPTLRGQSTNIAALTDAQALSEIAQGRVSALAVLYDRYHPRLYRFFANATGHAPDVEDLVQSTFLSAAKAAASFDGRESCRPWLLGIAAGALFRRRRTLARLGRMLRQFALCRSGHHLDAEHLVVARDNLRGVGRALSRLSEKKRVVLLLAELEGMPCEEIARALNIPIGTVWTRLHHARAELRDRLAAEERA